MRSLAIFRYLNSVALPSLNCLDVTLGGFSEAEVARDMTNWIKHRAELGISDFRLRGLQSDSVSFAHPLLLLHHLRILLVQGVIEPALFARLAERISRVQAIQLKIIRFRYCNHLDDVIPALIGFLERKATLGCNPAVEHIEFQPAIGAKSTGPALLYFSSLGLHQVLREQRIYDHDQDISAWFCAEFAEFFSGFLVYAISRSYCYYSGGSCRASKLCGDVWTNTLLARATALVAKRVNPWTWLDRGLLNFLHLLLDGKGLALLAIMLENSRIYLGLGFLFLLEPVLMGGDQRVRGLVQTAENCLMMYRFLCFMYVFV
ncbi:hypothetical protein AURDEDRAFT_176709 [Auricularia subglabra TFB-10046 SS5]|uniref:Uncharacterized protein n=1 Tax=Auricularia subglabra (strain TFB-10046 / SS5) TaxID=717982 RepID=J0WPA1_AURST|nr:hypothetical protein AURDEDRAFT_176709 [Auricularia subglabra TFB-10046 SS5]